MSGEPRNSLPRHPVPNLDLQESLTVFRVEQHHQIIDERADPEAIGKTVHAPVNGMLTVALR